MANIHRIDDLPRENNGNRPLLFQPNIAIPNPQLQAAVAARKIPFLRERDEGRSPLDESIPYTWKIIWCPAIQLLSVSTALIFICWVLYIWGLCLGIQHNTEYVLAVSFDVLVRMGAVEPTLVGEGQAWRLLTAAFLHYDLTHIVMNTLSALFFLTRLQDIYHPASIVTVLLVSAISGNVLVATTAGDHDIAVGASSMINGMLGAYVAYMAINWTVLAEIRTQLCCIIGVMCFFFLLSSLDDGISFAGHAGGFLGGLLWGMAILPPIGTKNICVTIAGGAGISIYLLTTFLVLFI